MTRQQLKSSNHAMLLATAYNQMNFGRQTQEHTPGLKEERQYRLHKIASNEIAWSQKPRLNKKTT